MGSAESCVRPICGDSLTDFRQFSSRRGFDSVVKCFPTSAGCGSWTSTHTLRLQGIALAVSQPGAALPGGELLEQSDPESAFQVSLLSFLQSGLPQIC
jgi:hypothetical protein